MVIPLKAEIDIEEAVGNITKAIQKAAWQATPDRNEQTPKEERPIIVKQKIAEKGNARNKSPTRQTKIQEASKRTKKICYTISKMKVFKTISKN